MLIPALPKQRRAFGDPVAAPKLHARFEPLPPSNRHSFNLPLGVALPQVAQALQGAPHLVFHTVGDTGGVHGPESQVEIADCMDDQWTNAAAADQPAFMYHLGDVVYFNGVSTQYPVQFYDPYKHYQPRIFAIPGNHDGDTGVRPGDPPDPEGSLFGFVQNFCDIQAHHVSPYRDSMTQPYVYWTLEAPFVTIVGLYSNVEGLLDGEGTNDQQQWLIEQLRTAPADKWLIVTVHHPPYSLDRFHGGSPDIGTALDQAMAAANRNPDAVFSGHVHDYQRFTRTLPDRQIPYVVAGAGGYANNGRLMHQVQRDAAGNPPTATPGAPFATTLQDVVLNAYDEINPGFLRITIDAQTLQGEYFSVPFGAAPPAARTDTFVVDWATHRVR